MSDTIDLGQYFDKQATKAEAVTKAQEALKAKMEVLMQFNKQAKVEIFDALSSGKTTVDPLTDEVILLFGLNRGFIERILAFNIRLIAGKKILIAVHRRDCIKHVIMPSPGNESEYATSTGYIYGILTGRKLVIKRKCEQPPSDIEMILPVARYVMWGFGQNGNNTETPVEKPLVIGRGNFGSLSCMNLLLSIVNDALPREICEPNDFICSRPQVFIDGVIPGHGDDPELYRISTAFERGHQMIQAATPSEIVAGADI